jgi:hypothetical protein
MAAASDATRGQAHNRCLAVIKKKSLNRDISSLGLFTSEQRTAPWRAVDVVLAAHHDALMNRPGVVMLGTTLDMHGLPVIHVGVKAKRDLTGLPNQLDDIPVVTQVIRDVKALPD